MLACQAVVVAERTLHRFAAAHRRIDGELARLGFMVAPSTVWQILRAAATAML